MHNLEWAQPLVSAPDLEAAGILIHQRLQLYVAAGAPSNEDALTERLAFEHHAGRFMTRANERQFDFSIRFPGFANDWGDFVDQNKAAEAEFQRLGRLQSYERGRADAATAMRQGWIGSATMSGTGDFAVPLAPALPGKPVGLTDAVHQVINNAVVAQLNQHIATLGVPTPAAEKSADPLPSVRSPAEEQNTAGNRMSEALELYLTPPDRKRQATAKGRPETAAVVRFAIEFLKDPYFNSITKEDWDRLDEALTDIPKTKNMPRRHHKSLYLRYQYAKKNGWENLERVTQATLLKRYHPHLNKFISWAIEEKYYAGEEPKFVCVDPENTTSLPRDAFEDHELIALFSLPLFTGCSSGHRIWKVGKYFLQNSLYWGYLILLCTGMRVSEVGQLKCIDIVTDGLGNWFFDLRPFDARKGRVALKDVRTLKTDSSGRIVPIHPLLIELGLIDRMHALEEMGEKRLLPEWRKYIRKDGTERWNDPMSKSWQYVKNEVLKITRADLTLHGLRHLMAEWLDVANIAERTRNRILGHAGRVPGRYGRKGMLDPKQVAAIEAIEPAVIGKIRKILLEAKEKADRGELVVLTPWLKPSGNR